MDIKEFDTLIYNILGQGVILLVGFIVILIIYFILNVNRKTNEVKQNYHNKIGYGTNGNNVTLESENESIVSIEK